MSSPIYTLTMRGRELLAVRYGDLTCACEDGMMWSAALRERVDVVNGQGVCVAWVDNTGAAI